MHAIDARYQHQRVTDPARFCFRCRRHRRHAGAYDVLIKLAGAKSECRIEIHHANVVVEERQPFTTGSLNARRSKRAVVLLGLAERIARKDRSRSIPGSLDFSARLKQPYILRPSVATRLHTRSTDERKTKKTAGACPAAKCRLGVIPTRPTAGDVFMQLSARRVRARHRYPLRSL